MNGITGGNGAARRVSWASGWRVAVTAVVIAAAIILPGWWFFNDPVGHFKPSMPGDDHKNAGTAVAAAKVEIGSDFKSLLSIPDVAGTRWPRFRGADFDNISKETIPLIDTWPGRKPGILWTRPLGEGHAAPAVYDGKIYLLDYDEQTRSDRLLCLDLATGRDLWYRGYRVHLKRNHGLSRTIPAVSDRFVVTIGPKCHVMCVERKTGALLWGLDITGEYGGEVPFWYTGQCPLLDGDTAVIATGGKAILAAFDCGSGRKLWETPNPGNLKMSHSSVIPMTLCGKRMYVYFAIGGVCGISAGGADRGTMLWQNTEFAPSVVAPSPVALGNDRILLTAGYGAGSAVVKVENAWGGFKASVVDRYKPQEGMASEQQTPVFFDGYLYGIQPKDAGALRNQFICCRADDTRRVVSGSGKTHRFGLGPYILADGKFYILNDDGGMTIARATPEQFTVLDTAGIIDGRDSWGPIALTGGYLLMRDSKQLVCLDIKKK